jgi:hypothetical protein
VPSRFQPLVFSRGLINFVKGTVGDVTSLTVAATPCDELIQLWNSGVGEEASGAGYPSGYKYVASDTNAGKQGRIVPQDYGYVLTGILFRCLQPVVITVTNGVATLAYGAWTDAYVKDMQGIILEHVSANLSFGRDGEKQGSLGNLGQWAQMSGMVHKDAPTNGLPYNNQFLMMFMGAFAGGTEDLNQITVDLTIDLTASIAQTTNATEIASSVGVPIECELIGYYVCPEDLGVCADGELKKFMRLQAMAAKMGG